MGLADEYKQKKLTAAQNGKIFHDYWIVNGKVFYAGDDIGNTTDYHRWMNHSGEAINHIVSRYTDKIEQLARQIGITEEDEYDFQSLGGDPSLTFDRLGEIIDRLKLKMPLEQVKSYIIKTIGANDIAYDVLTLQKDPTDYVLRYDNWILVRNNNVELYGYDTTKQKNLANGLQEIRIKEGIRVPEDQLQLAIYDFKTGKSWYATEEDIGHPNITARPQQLPTTTYNRPIYHLTNPQDSEENKYSVKTPGKISPTNNLWRGTSECMNFKEWCDGI